MDRLGVCIKMAGDGTLAGALAETAMGKELERLKAEVEAVSKERDYYRDMLHQRDELRLRSAQQRYFTAHHQRRAAFKRHLMDFVHLFVVREEDEATDPKYTR